MIKKVRIEFMELRDDTTYMKPCTKTWNQCEKVD